MNLEETLETNKRQKDFYNSAGSKKKNLPSRIWSKLRNGLLSDFRKQFDLKDRVYAYSGENGHPFRRKADSHSGVKRTSVPFQNGQ